ncbi:MAG: type II toxin-antitoxin system VapC family toxin [Rhodospirillales bacterium]
MGNIVLDASAALAVLKNEPGRDVVMAHVPGGTMSAVNIAEVVDKLSASGMDEVEVRTFVSTLGVEIVPFDEELAFSTGMLHPVTRHRGLSLGDRACLALAGLLELPVLTADRAWTGLDLGIDVQVVRP